MRSNKVRKDGRFSGKIESEMGEKVKVMKWVKL